MDYFYVENYNGRNGLIDLYIPLMFKVKKWNFGVKPHYFMAAATISSLNENNKSIKGGYSQMFATETMQMVKYPENPSDDFYKNANNRRWIMLTLKPMFFYSDKKKPKT